MNDKLMRVKVESQLYKRYRVICAQNDLSMNKQSAELIRKFVEIQEQNYKTTKG